MNAQVLGLAAKFDALAKRERLLVLLALIGGVVLLGWTFGVEPALGRARAAERGLAEVAVQRQALQAQLQVLQAPAQNPDVRARSELEALRVDLARVGERLASFEGALVPPQRMSRLLEEMIGRRSSLRLLSLRTLPVAPVLAPASVEGAKATAPQTRADSAGALYKHGVEIRLEGSYAELTEYLARLEKSPQKLLWGRAALSAEQHPRLVLTLTVYTLSLERTWLIV